jgi:hypothetical protein
MDLYQKPSKKNLLILTQSYIYCSKLFRSWLQIPMLIMSPKRSLEDILCLLRFLLLLHHPDCCRVMYCYSTFLFHYYYITSTIVGWCIAILRFYIYDCVKISRFFCWLCPSYILNEIVKLLLNNTFIFPRFFYHGSVSKTFSYTLK